MTMADRNISITLITMFSLPLLSIIHCPILAPTIAPLVQWQCPKGGFRALQKSKDQFMVNANFKVISIIHGC